MRDLLMDVLSREMPASRVWGVAESLLPTVRKLVAEERGAEREAVLQALVRHGQGETNLYDELGHGAHR